MLCSTAESKPLRGHPTPLVSVRLRMCDPFEKWAAGARPNTRVPARLPTSTPRGREKRETSMRRVLVAAMLLDSSPELSSLRNLGLLAHVALLLPAFREPHVFVYRVRRAAQCRGAPVMSPLREEGSGWGSPEPSVTCRVRGSLRPAPPPAAVRQIRFRSQEAQPLR